MMHGNGSPAWSVPAFALRASICTMGVGLGSSIGLAQEANSPGATQTPETAEQSSDWHFVFSPSGRYAMTTDVDNNNGDFNVWRGGFEVNAIGPLNDQIQLLLGASYELNAYDFSGPNSFIAGMTDPFGSVHIVRLTSGAQGQLDERWSWNAGVGAEFAGEFGADLSDTASFFGWIRGDTQISEAVNIGIGLLVKTQIEDDVLFFPAAGLRWQIDEDFRLEIEGARAELSTDMDGGVRVGVGAAYENRRFRLDDGAPVNSAVVEDTGVPVFALVQYEPNAGTSISFECGVVVFQEFDVENQFGNMRRTFETDPAPYAGFSVDFRF